MRKPIQVVRCYRCGMHFRVEHPPHAHTEISTCPVRGCLLKFWAAKTIETGYIRVGITKEEYARRFVSEDIPSS